MISETDFPLARSMFNRRNSPEEDQAAALPGELAACY